MHLFLSPHLDDAVLSCGGLIHHLTSGGTQVVVLTIMAGDPPEPLPETPLVRDLHDRWRASAPASAALNPVAVRRREDLDSCRAVGAVAQHREYLDCIYRTHADLRALYPTVESIFGEVHPADTVGKYLSIESLMFPFVYPDLERLYAPLGVGHHVDHQIVRDWALEIAERHPHIPIAFYPEYPYTRDPDAIRRAGALLPPTFRLTHETAPLTEADMAARIESIRRHRSQFTTFWTSDEAMQNEIRARFCIGDGVFAEYLFLLAGS
jgi:LmbE family N-acetylglucosaminyl deacetylase